jgi:hypothetical protein
VHHREAAFCIVAIALAGCVSVISEPEPPASLPTPSLVTVPVTSCRAVAGTGVLRSDPQRVPPVWLETPGGGKNVAFPTGYRAMWRSAGGSIYIEVLDETGRLFMTTTDVVGLGHICESGLQDTVLLMRTTP